MKKGFLSLCAAILCSTSAIAQDNSLLYEVTGNGLTQPSYLYGTFHLVCPNDLVLTEATKKAVADTKQLYLEIDMDDPALQSSMMRSMMLTGGKTLKDYLPADDYTLLDNHLKATSGMGLAQVGGLKPIAIYSFMTMGALGCQPASYDMTLMQMAANDKKEILGLEKLEDQLAIFDKIPMEKQVTMLADMARKPGEVKAELDKLLAAYKSQDLTAMMKQMKESKYDGGLDDFEADLLDKRNQNWIPVIEKAVKDKPTLFAFGAGHLGGDKGVINLLRQKGYTVKGIR
ncbi:TraB/GumN family protein [Rudanella paleaurantiibacter]|uniref:TraB/GumN family protein n=1 Tax=Rudanella paleaurantiibacter TaxID=2614655 RepID=A0A7J5TZH0_9BACT|nr:TraB/GumN family protein [Rudanella paleaurantiibacter]KAB7730357.1 TraB/GumN family protein [Rudanella paleaurantiibacter]